MGSGRLSGMRFLAVSSPLWAFACHVDLTRVPDLEFDVGPASVGLYPTGTPVFVDVAGPDETTSGGSCDGATTEYNVLTFVEGDCGEDCTVEATGSGALPGSIRLRVQASSPGEKALRVVVADETLGEREHTVTLEFAEVTRTEVVRDAMRDPGTTAAMLTGMVPEWCVRAFSGDRPVALDRSPTGFESLTSAFSLANPFADFGRECWEFGAVLRGEGHLRVSAAGQVIELFPVARADADIAEVHLHELGESPLTWIPVDAESEIEGRELSSAVVASSAHSLALFVRLVTKDGELARGGAERFEIDGQFTVEAEAGGQVLRLSRWGAQVPPHTCLRAEIGEVRFEFPVFVGGPLGAADPCAEPGLGAGGAGGAGGFGGEGP